MNRIILVGNGFDLAHGLPTSYKDFINWYWNTRVDGFQGNITKKSSDKLCEFIIKDDTFLCWNVFAFQHIPSFGNINGRKIVSDIRAANESFEVRLCPFFESIEHSIEEKNWVDIENEYYALLKHYSRNIEDANKIYELNSQLDFLKEKLIEYLSLSLRAVRNQFVVDKALKRKIFEPISYRDVAVSSKKYLYEFIDYHASLEESEWASLLSSYDRTDVFYRLQEVKSIVEKVRKHSSEKGLSSYRWNQYDSEDFLLPDKILILNFNYTDIADRYLPNVNIFETNHIHGELSEGHSVIFGYGDELDKNYEELKDLNNNECLRNMKSTKYLEASNYRQLLSFIDSAPFQIYIMGHSCGNSDRTLLNTLFEHDNCVSIKPFYHQKDDGTDNYLDIVQNTSRNFTDMKKMRDRVVNKTYCEPLPQLKKAVNDNE